MTTRMNPHRRQTRPARAHPPKADPRQTKSNNKSEEKAAPPGAEETAPPESAQATPATTQQVEPQGNHKEPQPSSPDDPSYPGYFQCAQREEPNPNSLDDPRRKSDPATSGPVGAAGWGADTSPEEAPWTPTAGALPAVGSPATEGAREAIAKAGMIEAQLRGERTRSDQEMEELHEILESIISHLGNHSRQLHAQDGQISDLRAQLNNLEGSANCDRNGR